MRYVPKYSQVPAIVDTSFQLSILKRIPMPMALTLVITRAHPHDEMVWNVAISCA